MQHLSSDYLVGEEGVDIFDIGPNSIEKNLIPFHLSTSVLKETEKKYYGFNAFSSFLPTTTRLGEPI